MIKEYGQISGLNVFQSLTGTGAEQVIEEYGEIPDDETIAAAQSVSQSVDDVTAHIPGSNQSYVWL